MSDGIFEYKSKNFMRDGESINVFKYNSVRDNPLHTHDFVELVYILKGNGTEWINGKEFYVKRGDLVFVNHWQTHAFHPGDDGMTYINVMINLEFISERLINSDNAFEVLTLAAFDDIRDDVDKDLSVVTFSEDEYKSIENVLKAMLSEYEAKEPAYIAVLSGYLNVLFAKMVRKMRVGIGETEQSDIWKELVAYISENLSEDLTLTALSKRCFYNPSYFSRVFKEKFGLTLTEYITGKRLEHAAYLLSSENSSAERIAVECGFSGKAAFYRAFAKKYGCTPNEYRNKER